MRADKFFAEKFGSRTKAQYALLEGKVLRDGVPLSPDDEVKEGEDFTFLDGERFVSRGGDKLERGLSSFFESVEGCTVCDLGSSTGGFCDCLLQRGAAKVYCVDVGQSQLAPSLCADPRVVVMDGTNARYLTAASFGNRVDVVTADLSFISLKLVLPAISEILGEGGRAFLLFKPQFECGGRIGKSGILPVSRHAELLKDFFAECERYSLAPQNIVPAPIRPKKNVEYMVFLQKGGRSVGAAELLSRIKNF